MLQLLRWPAAILLLVFLFVWPVTIGLLPIVWIIGRMLYGRSPFTILISLGIIALGGSLFLGLVGALPNVLVVVLVATCLIVIAYKPCEEQLYIHKTREKDDIIEAEVISVTTIYHE